MDLGIDAAAWIRWPMRSATPCVDPWQVANAIKTIIIHTSWRSLGLSVPGVRVRGQRRKSQHLCRAGRSTEEASSGPDSCPGP